MAKKKKKKRNTHRKSKTCSVCGCELCLPGGFGETGMCGPCCTGESATLSEFGETW
jgi:hypothetical protein